MFQHILLMDMYDMTKEANIYTNLSNEDQTFQLEEIPYKDYKKAIVNIMHNSTVKTNAVKNSRQTVPYEKSRVLHKSDSDDSSCDASISSIE